MALPRSRAMNRGRGKGSPVRGSAYDNPQGRKAGGAPGSEHDYTGNNKTGDDHDAVSMGRKGSTGGMPGAGQLDYGTHGTPGPAAKRYVGMDAGEYPSRPTPSPKVSNMSTYKEGNPPPKGYKYPSAVGGANSGRIGRSKASSTY